MKLFVCGFGRRSDKGLFSCADGEAAGCDLFRKGLVEVIVHTLKGGRVKAVGENRGPAYDVAASLQFLYTAFLHFCLDAAADSVSLGLGFFHKGFPFVESFDFGDEFVS